MSGFEIAGVILGGIPLIISGLEHWQHIAKISGYSRVRKEHVRCLRDLKFYELLYKQNLKDLLLPIVTHPDDVDCLISNPGSQEWGDKTLADRLAGHLKDAYTLYMELIEDMNSAVRQLIKLLDIEGIYPSGQATSHLQQQGPSILLSARTKLSFELYKIKFCLSEDKRNELFDRLKEGTSKLETLLNRSNKSSALGSTAQASSDSPNYILETIINESRTKASVLFSSLQRAWQCGCQTCHYANLRLEHRTTRKICFEIVLMSSSTPFEATNNWTWRQFQCGDLDGCSASQPQHLRTTTPLRDRSLNIAYRSLDQEYSTSRQRKRVRFNSEDRLLSPSGDNFYLTRSTEMKLCEHVKTRTQDACVDVINENNEIYHLHKINAMGAPDDFQSFTLDTILSANYKGHLSRCRRYYLALLLASSVAQLQSTEWLQDIMQKSDVLFFPRTTEKGDISLNEPFLRQGFSPNPTLSSQVVINSHLFYYLGILLIELCFGTRLEDHPLRLQSPSEPRSTKQAFDILVGLEWSKEVEEEGGSDYATAVRWCFAGPKTSALSWRSDLIQNVVIPLEECQKHFRVVEAI